jgi:hypothetical protein
MPLQQTQRARARRSNSTPASTAAALVSEHAPALVPTRLPDWTRTRRAVAGAGLPLAPENAELWRPRTTARSPTRSRAASRRESESDRANCGSRTPEIGRLGTLGPGRAHSCFPLVTSVGADSRGRMLLGGCARPVRRPSHRIRTIAMSHCTRPVGRCRPDKSKRPRDGRSADLQEELPVPVALPGAAES